MFLIGVVLGILMYERYRVVCSFRFYVEDFHFFFLKIKIEFRKMMLW